ncbi:MAG: hypothetical protein LBI54_02150 [Lachnospiraceae bacterium]|jgi:hypothetical protein|nr:hypothetical protein [Lachnospiraceae bacterium]
MKSKLLFMAIGNIDDSFIDEDAEVTASGKEGKNGRAATFAPWGKGLLPLAACLVLAVFIGPRLFNNQVEVESPAPSPVANPPAQENVAQAEIAIVPRWEEMSMPQKFSRVMFNGVEYTVTTVFFSPFVSSGFDADGREIAAFAGSQYGTLEIAPTEIGELIGAATARGYDSYEGKEYTADCEIYALHNIASECAVAVKFAGDEGYYPFKNPYYEPATLGDLIDGLNLRENLVFNRIHYDYFEDGAYVMSVYTLTDYDVLWDFLLADTAAKNAPEMLGAGLMEVSIDVNVIGYRNISLAVNDQGYLQTNILDTGKAFYIGEDRVRAFMDYVLANGTRTDVWQVGGDGEQGEEKRE